MKTQPHTYTYSPQRAWHVGRTTVSVVALLTLLGACCNYTPPEMPQAEAAMDAVQVIKAGTLKTLLENNKGKVIVLNFWATWCAPCVAEIPELKAFYEEHKGDNLAFLAISLDSPDGIEDTVAPFVKDKKVPFPVYVLQERNLDVISKTVKQELAGVLPTTLIYDPKGKVNKTFEGGITKEDLEAVVKPLLK